MVEASSEFPKPAESIAQRQYESSLNLACRWEVYKNVTHPIDFYELTYDNLKLSGNEAVLDIGCAGGSGLLKLLQEYEHSGSLTGVDSSSDVIDQAQLFANAHGSSIEFQVADCQNLSQFINNEFDVTLALFMLYHAEDPQLALKEIARVTKKSGMVAVATSGPTNKIYHRKFEAQIAEFLDIKPPPVFSKKFDSEAAELQLPEIFEVFCKIEQNCEMRITESNVNDYIDSLFSMKSNFSPIPRREDFVKALEFVVLPQIKLDIVKNGFFGDTVSRHLYLCKNTYK